MNQRQRLPIAFFVFALGGGALFMLGFYTGTWIFAVCGVMAIVAANVVVLKARSR